MKKEYLLVNDEKEYKILITGFFIVYIEILLNNEQVYFCRLKPEGNPVKQIIFYKNSIKHVLYIIMDYNIFWKSKLIMIVNNCIYLGTKKQVIKIVQQKRTQIFDSLFFSRHKILAHVLLYSCFNGFVFTLLVALITYLRNEPIIHQMVLVYFSVYTILTGIFRWRLLRNADVNGIDEIDFEMIYESAKPECQPTASA
jgi:hypothetical protein